MKRQIVLSPAYVEFERQANARVREKLSYAVAILQNVCPLSAKFVKKLTNTDFYELRVSAGDEIRVIIFAADSDNINTAARIVLLNGFVKKIDQRLCERDGQSYQHLKITDMTTTDKLTAEERERLRRIDFSGKSGFVTADDYLNSRAGAAGTPERDEFDAKAKAWYYGEVLRSRRKSIGMTQKQLAERIGRERTYINRVERGETDMQLSSFIRIAAALGITLRLDINLD